MIVDKQVEEAHDKHCSFLALTYIKQYPIRCIALAVCDHRWIVEKEYKDEDHDFVKCLLHVVNPRSDAMPKNWDQCDKNFLHREQVCLVCSSVHEKGPVLFSSEWCPYILFIERGYGERAHIDMVRVT